MCSTQQVDAKKSDQVFKIVDNVLRQVFGEKATDLIYQHLEKQYSLQRSEFPAKIELFAKGLEAFLRSGAPLIERKIVADLYATYGMFRRMEAINAHDDYDFAGQVKIFMQSA